MLKVIDLNFLLKCVFQLGAITILCPHPFAIVNSPKRLWQLFLSPEPTFLTPLANGTKHTPADFLKQCGQKEIILWQTKVFMTQNVT